MIERGKYNDIHQSTKIHQSVIISGWTFIGKNVYIKKNCRFGNHVDINSDCFIDEGCNIQAFCSLNSGTMLGKNVFFSTGVHTLDEVYPSIDMNQENKVPCIIKDGAIICDYASLVSVIIGRNSVIGAKALILSNVPDNEVWVGTPAKFLMTRKEFDDKGTQQ